MGGSALRSGSCWRPGSLALAESGPEVWDANHDGVYTCAEWKSYLDRMFTLADRNRDGHLDAKEFETVRPAQPKRDRFH